MENCLANNCGMRGVTTEQEAAEKSCFVPEYEELDSISVWGINQCLDPISLRTKLKFQHQLCVYLIFIPFWGSNS